MLSRDPQLINSFDGCLDTLEQELSALKQKAMQMDASSDYSSLLSDLAQIKQLYERAEFLLLQQGGDAS